MPIHVALVPDPAGQGSAEQVQDGVRKAAGALADAGYLVEEIAPPSIDLAARTCLAMLNTPEIRVLWAITARMAPEDTRRFLTAFYEAAGDPDPVATVQSFATRHSLLRAWAEFQQSYPLIVAAICTEIPFRAGTDLSEGRVAEEIKACG